MLWIYLPLSTDLKLCSDVPTVDFVDTWTFITIFTSRHLGPSIWVPSFGSLDCGSQHLGPEHSKPESLGLGTWVPSFGSRVLGPRNPFRAFAPNLNIKINFSIFSPFNFPFFQVLREKYWERRGEIRESSEINFY